MGIVEETNSRELGLLNFRYYLFDKFPLYITGGLGRDWISSNKRIEYEYSYQSSRGTIQNSPVVHEHETMPANYRFLGLGFQWVFQNGFFIGVEKLLLLSRYTEKGSSIILDRNYSVNGVLFEAFVRTSDYSKKTGTDFDNLRFGYSIGF